MNEILNRRTGAGVAWPLLVVSALLSPVSGAQNTALLEYSLDVTDSVRGITLNDENIGVEQSGSIGVSVLNLPGLPGAADVDAFHRDGPQDILFSTDVTATLPSGLTVEPGDIVSYNGSNYSIEFDASSFGFPGGGNVDAVSRDASGRLLLSFDTAIGNFEQSDIVAVDRSSLVTVFSGRSNGVPEAADIDAIQAAPGGAFLVSFDVSGSIDAISFSDASIVAVGPGPSTLKYEVPTGAGADVDAFSAEFDSDGDGIGDRTDNCPNTPNANQADSDSDGAGNLCDNCLLAPNGPLIPDAGGNIQLDTNNDGFGNACDADLDGTGFVNFADLADFKSVFGTSSPDADLDGTGVVNFVDLALFKSLFGQPVGPSGIAP